MTLPARPRDGYLAALAAIAPNAARLKEAYSANLGRALLIAVNIHLLALGAYWVATVALRADTAEAAPIPKGVVWIPTHPNFPPTQPDIAPRTPPRTGGGPSQPAASGVITPVDDAQAPDVTVATQDEMAVSQSGPVREGPPSAGDDTGGDAGPSVPQRPDPPVNRTDPPEVPQQPDPVVETPSNEVIDISEVPPTIIGGLEGMQARVTYPRFEREIGNQGTVVVRFVVEPSGEPSGIEIARSVSPGLDAAAVAAIRETRFTAGVQNGRPVRVRMTLPVRFTIR